MVPLSLVMEGSKTSEATKQQIKRFLFTLSWADVAVEGMRKLFWIVDWKVEKDEETS